MIVTIDGPMASGKSSVGRMLAQKLGYYYVYSGLIYRALAFILVQKGYSIDSLVNPSINDLYELLIPGRFFYAYDDQQKELIFFDNQNITKFLKTSTIDAAASVLSTHCLVRNFVTEFQRKIAKQRHCIVDGRDAGSIVFPVASKDFLNCLFGRSNSAVDKTTGKTK